MSIEKRTKTNCGVSGPWEWNPEDIIAPPHKIGNGHICLILNREIRVPPHAVTNLWQNGNKCRTNIIKMNE